MISFPEAHNHYHSPARRRSDKGRPVRDAAFLTHTPLHSVDTTIPLLLIFSQSPLPQITHPNSKAEEAEEAEEAPAVLDWCFAKALPCHCSMSAGKAILPGSGKADTTMLEVGRNEWLGVGSLRGKSPAAVTTSPCRRSARSAAPQKRRLAKAT